MHKTLSGTAPAKTVKSSWTSLCPRLCPWSPTGSVFKSQWLEAFSFALPFSRKVLIPDSHEMGCLCFYLDGITAERPFLTIPSEILKRIALLAHGYEGSKSDHLNLNLPKQGSKEEIIERIRVEVYLYLRKQFK